MQVNQGVDRWSLGLELSEGILSLDNAQDNDESALPKHLIDVRGYDPALHVDTPKCHGRRVRGSL